MDGTLCLYAASVFLIFWGIAHLFPTRSVVRGFGDISPDNRRIIYMEWIIEGVALVFMGVLIAGVTAVDPAHASAAVVYWITSAALVVLIFVSLLTGARIAFFPFRLCPVIFLTAVVLLQIGMRSV